MSLADNYRQRTTMLCAMYLAQGIPWGFMTIALIAFLTQQGADAKEAGDLTAIVLIPWTFKLIWGPIIDSMTIRSMGRRRAWIIGAELMMAVSLLGLLLMGDFSGDVKLLGWMFFIHNCFASLQDVATDALAVDVLPVSEQGRVNGLMWGSKLVGKAIGATGFARVMDAWGLQTAVVLQFAILLVIMLFPLLMLERSGEKRFPWSPGEASGDDGTSSLRSPVSVFKDLIRAFSLPATFAFFVYGIFHVVGWGLVEIFSKIVCMQELGWEYVDYTDVVGWAVIGELVAALAGGWVADRYGRRKVIVFGFGLYGLLAIAFGVCAHLWQDDRFVWMYLFLNPGVLAIGSVGFLSMGMQVCWTRSSATMFTMFMTMSNVGHVIGNKLAGPLENWNVSYENCFVIAGLTMIAPLLLLPIVKPERVALARERDAESTA
jgi:PAT family beta-lactamase induction signal transducer AmpG